MIDVRIVRLRSGRNSDSLCLEYTPAVYVRGNGSSLKLFRERLGITVKAEAFTLYDLEYNSRMFQVAEGIRQERLEAIRKGQIIACSPNESFLDFYRVLRDEKKYNLSAGLSVFCKFCNDRCSFGEVTSAFCSEYLEYLHILASSGIIRQSTAGLYFRQFCMVIRQASERGMLGLMPDLPDCPTSAGSDSAKGITTAELDILMKTPCPRKVLKSIVAFTVLTGLRTGEILAMRWDKFNVDREGRRFVSIPSRGKSKRNLKRIYVSEEAFGHLPKPRKSGYVYPRFKSHELCDFITEWTSSAGLEGRFTLESFRHLRKDTIPSF